LLLCLVCDEFSQSRIAVIGIGRHPIFKHIQAIADSLKIPYIAIKWESLEEENELLVKVAQSAIDRKPIEINHVNIHPSANNLMKSVIHLVDYYKWEFVTVLYQESTGLDRVEDLIKLPRNFIDENNKMRIQVRQLSEDVNKWIYLLKDIKLSGSSHLIVDIQTKYMNTFLKQVRNSASKYFLFFLFD
jgi:hypothetical protein